MSFQAARYVEQMTQDFSISIHMTFVDECAEKIEEASLGRAREELPRYLPAC